MRGAWTPSRSSSWKLQMYFVRGQLPNPPATASYGSSWQAPNRLGSEQSGVRVRSPRSRRNASASSSVASARSGVRRHSKSRRSWSSRRAGTPSLYSLPVATAAILTIGNELTSGDVPNTNGSWIAKRLETLGVHVRLIAALPDDIDAIAAFVRVEAPAVDFLLVTGG